MKSETDKIISEIVKGLEELEPIRFLDSEEYRRLKVIQNERETKKIQRPNI